MADDDLRVDSRQAEREIPAPQIEYLPPMPRGPSPGIGLVGCGGVSAYHLAAYREAGFPVVALCSRTRAKAEARRDEFAPHADVCDDWRELIARDDVGVVDLAVHAEIRAEMIEAALRAGKHVLSQKPFVTDLDVGLRLCNLADERGLKLAVNQNGRWAPHWSFIRQALADGVIGDVAGVHLSVQWDHTWTRGTAFDDMRDLVLFDFGIHWFDIVSCFLHGREPRRVFATRGRAAGQSNKAPMQAQALIEYEGAQASITFDAAALHGARDSTVAVGTKGTLRSEGPDLNHQSVTLYTEEGVARPVLEGEWFRNGFVGTMAELLCAVEQQRAPYNSGRDNLRGLAICFAAMLSSWHQEAVVPGQARTAH